MSRDPIEQDPGLTAMYSPGHRYRPSDWNLRSVMGLRQRGEALLRKLHDLISSQGELLAQNLLSLAVLRPHVCHSDH